MSKRAKFTDPRGQHVRLYKDIVKSPAWLGLSMAERGFYVTIRSQVTSFNNGNIEASLGTLKHSGVASSATLSKCLRALTTVGLIGKTRQGGIAWGRKVCSLYRFTDEPVIALPKADIKAMPATNEWKKFETVKSVKHALKIAHEDAKRSPAADESGLQELKLIDSESEASRVANASDSEADAFAPVQKLKQTLEANIALEVA